MRGGSGVAAGIVYRCRGRRGAGRGRGARGGDGPRAPGRDPLRRGAHRVRLSRLRRGRHRRHEEEVARVRDQVLRDRDTRHALLRQVRGGRGEDRGASRPQGREVLGREARGREQPVLPRQEGGVLEDIRRVLQGVPPAHEGDTRVLHAGVLRLGADPRRRQALRGGGQGLRGAPQAHQQEEERRRREHVVQRRERDGGDVPQARDGREGRQEAQAVPRSRQEDRRPAAVGDGPSGVLRPRDRDEGEHRAPQGRRR